MGLFGKSDMDEERDRLLRELELLLDSKTQRLTFIEESLAGITELLQKEGGPGRPSMLLQQECEAAKDEVLRLSEKNTELLRKLRVYEKAGDTAMAEATASPPTGQDELISALRSRIAVLEQELANASTAPAPVTKEQVDTDTLLELLLPSCLSIEPLAPFVESWKSKLTSATPDFRLLSMLSNLLTWTCAVETARETPENFTAALKKESMNALFLFGRYFFEHMYQCGKDAEEAENIGRLLLENLNKALMKISAGYELFMPYLSEPYEAKYMLLDARGAQTGEIEFLRSWGIKDSENGMTYNKCHVQLC